jgi:hypothetical protein
MSEALWLLCCTAFTSFVLVFAYALWTVNATAQNAMPPVVNPDSAK